MTLCIVVLSFSGTSGNNVCELFASSRFHHQIITRPPHDLGGLEGGEFLLLKCRGRSPFLSLGVYRGGSLRLWFVFAALSKREILFWRFWPLLNVLSLLSQLFSLLVVGLEV